MMDQPALLQLLALPQIKGLIAILVAIAVYYASSRALRRVSAEGILEPRLFSLLLGAVRWLVLIVLFLVLLSVVGVSVGTLWAGFTGVLALVAVGVVAMWSILSNVTCSVLLIIFAPFRIGDEIEIQETTNEFFVRGRVIGINMLFTSLEATRETESGTEQTVLRVPNNQFFQKYVRRIPGQRTQSLKKFVSEKQE